jgi:hypothetical protein
MADPGHTLQINAASQVHAKGIRPALACCAQCVQVQGHQLLRALTGYRLAKAKCVLGVDIDRQGHVPSGG